jgi:ribosomal RNA-processing protein 1
MTTVSVDFLQQITLLGILFFSTYPIDPLNRKQIITELKKILTKALLISDYKKIWKALYYGITH